MKTATTFIFSILFCCDVLASCIESGLEQYFNNADAVFTGKVKNIYYTCNLWLNIADPNTLRDRPAIRSCHGGNSVARIEVEKVFKDSWDQLESSEERHGVLVVSDGSTAGIPLMLDRGYLLFAKSFAGSIYFVGACDGSKFIETANGELSQLEEIREALKGEIAP